MALATNRGLVNRRGAERAREILAPISGDHNRAAEALLCDPEYAAEMTPARVTAALRAVTPALLVEARELAAAKQLPTWRALTATLYRRRGEKRPRRARVLDPAKGWPDPKPQPGARGFDGLGAIVMPLPLLAVLVGQGPLLRSDAVEAVYKYVWTHDLLDAIDRHVVVADAKLRGIFGRDHFAMSEMDALFAPHLRLAA